MIAELITLIDDIVKYGLQPNLTVDNRDLTLEKNLVRLYAMYFEAPEAFDDNDYPDFDQSLPDLRKNIISNFPNFEFYKEVLDINDFAKWNDIVTGDAIDDLHDIIRDLLEVKWRLHYNSHSDGLWYFKFTFASHLKDHVIGLLKYMAELANNADDK